MCDELTLHLMYFVNYYNLYYSFYILGVIHCWTVFHDSTDAVCVVRVDLFPHTKVVVRAGPKSDLCFSYPPFISHIQFLPKTTIEITV